MQFKPVRVNTVIIGGGIAGLWLLHSLRKQGIDAVLLESNALGAGQTGASQGIIHGGAKYALTGFLNRASQSIADMPRIWDDCLYGKGSVDLTAARILSPAQFMWTTRHIASQAKIYFASYFLRGRCELVTPDRYPEIFHDKKMRGHVYQLSEKVLDVYSVLKTLAKPYKDSILKAEKDKTSFKVSNGDIQGIDYVDNGNFFRLEADNYILTAGEGVPDILARSLFLNVPMQRRPLRMALVTFDGIAPLYAHCVGRGNTPLLTITSHRNFNNQWVWYVGGGIAENGAKMDSDDHKKLLIQRLKYCLPHLSFKNLRIESFLINRAEPYMKDRKRPSMPFVFNDKNITVVWPTKLAFAPMLPTLVQPYIQHQHLASHGVNHLQEWPKATVAKPIWDRLS